MQKKYLFLIFSLLIHIACFSSRCTSNGNGPWIPAPMMWSCGHMPSCLDSIIIRASDSIWISNTVDYTNPPFSCTSPMYLTISGTLGFQTGKKLILPAGSIITLNASGRISPTGGGGSANLIDIGGVNVWSSDYGTVTGPLTITQFTPLPIELISFTANAVNDAVQLNWTTASEKNNNYFTIQRTADAIVFEDIDKLNGAGNSSSILNYSYTDYSPLEGKSYYRLKQTDYDGKYSYSPLIPLVFENKTEFSFDFYPNPIHSENINVAIREKEATEVLVVVYDVNGKESFSKVVITEVNGNNVYAIDNTNQLSPGIYIITATSQQKIYSKRLIVQ
jgi:hypothetical protein